MFHGNRYSVSRTLLWAYFNFYYENNQQDALYRLIYYSKSDLHVSGDVFAHHQEHLTVFTVSGSVHPSCCWLVSHSGPFLSCYLLLLQTVFRARTVGTVLTNFISWFSLLNYENNQQDALYRLIYYSKSVLHVSGEVFAHHQEHLTVFTVFGSVHPTCCRLAAGSNLGEHYQIL